MSEVMVRSLSEVVAEEVRVILARRRLSETQLARKLNVSQTWVWRRMAGKTSFSLDDLEMVAKELEVPVMTFLRSAEQAPSATSEYLGVAGQPSSVTHGLLSLSDQAVSATYAYLSPTEKVRAHKASVRRSPIRLSAIRPKTQRTMPAPKTPAPRDATRRPKRIFRTHGV